MPKPRLDRTAILVAIIAAAAAITGSYWQFVWKPYHRDTSDVWDYYGRVLDATSASPIKNAKISLELSGAPPVIYTDSEGIFRFTLPSRGSNEHIVGRIVVEAPGYERYDRFVDLTGQRKSLEDVRLSRSGVASSDLGVRNVVVAEEPSGYRLEVVAYNPRQTSVLVQGIGLKRQIEEFGVMCCCLIGPPPEYLVRDRVSLSSHASSPRSFIGRVFTKAGEAGSVEYALRGMAQAGCGWNYLELQFDTSFVLPPQAYKPMFVHVPKTLRIGTVRERPSFPFSIDQKQTGDSGDPKDVLREPAPDEKTIEATMSPIGSGYLPDVFDIRVDLRTDAGRLSYTRSLVSENPSVFGLAFDDEEWRKITAEAKKGKR